MVLYHVSEEWLCYTLKIRKTALSVGQGLWKFRHALWPLKRYRNVSAAKGNHLKRPHKSYIMIVYVPRTPGQPTEVFQIFREAHLKRNLAKCQLFQKEARYLHHVVSFEGLTAYPKKLKALQEWWTPRDKHVQRSFLGLCTYYKRFIFVLANIAKPLTRLKGETSFSLVPRNRGHLPVAEGHPMYYTLPWAPVTRREVHH